MCNVSFISFHILFFDCTHSLCIFIGTVLLDLECFDLSSIFESVVENMVITDQISRANKENVIDILMSKHRHQHQQSKLKRNFSFSSLSSFTFDAPTPTREKDSGHESGLEMEARNDVNVEKETVVMLTNVPEGDDDQTKENNKESKNSVVFELGDIDIDEEDKAHEPLTKESFNMDSSDDEKVGQFLSLILIIVYHIFTGGPLQERVTAITKASV